VIPPQNAAIAMVVAIGLNGRTRRRGSHASRDGLAAVALSHSGQGGVDDGDGKAAWFPFIASAIGDPMAGNAVSADRMRDFGRARRSVGSSSATASAGVRICGISSTMSRETFRWRFTFFAVAMGDTPRIVPTIW